MRVLIVMFAGVLLLAVVWVFLLRNGTLALTPRAGGGLHVTVRLPAAPPDSVR